MLILASPLSFSSSSSSSQSHRQGPSGHNSKVEEFLAETLHYGASQCIFVVVVIVVVKFTTSTERLPPQARHDRQAHNSSARPHHCSRRHRHRHRLPEVVVQGSEVTAAKSLVNTLYCGVSQCVAGVMNSMTRTERLWSQARLDVKTHRFSVVLLHFRRRPEVTVQRSEFTAARSTNFSPRHSTVELHGALSSSASLSFLLSISP